MILKPNENNKSRQAISRTVTVVGLIVILVLAAVIGIYYTTMSKSTSSTTSTTNSNTSTSSTTSVTTSSQGSFTLNPSNASQLIDESPTAAYDSLDPAVGFFVTDGYFANVFQGLVQYSSTNSTAVVPSLASSWTVSSNSENYTFSMRSGTDFSNKDAITSYTAWFSFVRGNWINAPSTAYYSNWIDLFYSGGSPYSSSCSTTNPSSSCQTMPDSHGNVWPWGLKAALSSTFNIPITNENKLVAALNNVLSHFNPSNASQVALMSDPHQAFVASSASTFQMNLIQPYSLLLLALPPQWGAIVDPTYIDANGGVTNNTVVSAFSTGGMIGSGPYEYGTVGPSGSFVVLNANPNYWAKGVSGLAPVLQPAVIPTIIIRFGDEPNTEIQDFGSNNAQIVFPTISEFGNLYSTYKYASYFPFSKLLVNTGAPLCDLANGINTQVYPTNSTLLREGMVHAVNYTQILDQLYVYNGQALASLSLPPVPPGWGPLDNPQNTSLYSYDPNLAASYINQAGIQGHWFTTMTNGTVLGDQKGKVLPSIEYAYVVPLTPQQQTINEILTTDLSAVGVNVVPTGITEGQYEVNEQSAQSTPPITGVGWCADWPDPIFQQFNDMATGAAHEANWVNNATLNTLAAEIPFQPNATLQLQETVQAYKIFTQLSTILQMPNQDNLFIIQPYVQNLVYSPFQFAIFYNLLSYSPATGTTS
ncbi:MAG: ABC transporter substrate-binding protein [Nitrososphaerales archaeon]|jgi:ABC-type transport system substrate-binding protein